LKKTLIDILAGFAVIIVVTIFEFLVTLPFGEPGQLSSEGYSAFINLEFLLTALPACLVTFMFIWLLKAKTSADWLRKAIVWTTMLALSYLLIGIGNGNFLEIFRTIGIYILLIASFAGPFFYFKVKNLKK
jgi:hypothetical protein